VFGIGNGGLSGCSKSKKRSTRAPSKRVKTRHPAATAAATLPAAVGKVTFITSFQMTAGGSTAVSSVTCTVSPVAVSGATLSYTFFHFGDPSIRRQTPPIVISIRHCQRMFPIVDRRLVSRAGCRQCAAR
jgi:hypothetical protein